MGSAAKPRSFAMYSSAPLTTLHHKTNSVHFRKGKAVAAELWRSK
jgi:hypothetical protein